MKENNITFPIRELWKDVKGYEGLYEVSNYGYVKSLDRTTTFIRGGKESSRFFSGRLMSNKYRDGYHEVHLRSGGESWKSVHRLVAEAFVPNTKGLPVVDHVDDTKDNNMYYNLKWCSVQYNTKKAQLAGNLSFGNKMYVQKLPESFKCEIRELLSQVVSVRKIERDLLVSQRSIARIRDGII